MSTKYVPPAHIYRIWITLDDIEGDTPEEAAPSIVRWLRDHPTHDVMVETRDETGAKVGVWVKGDPE